MDANVRREVESAVTRPGGPTRPEEYRERDPACPRPIEKLVEVAGHDRTDVGHHGAGLRERRSDPSRQPSRVLISRPVRRQRARGSPGTTRLGSRRARRLAGIIHEDVARVGSIALQASNRRGGARGGRMRGATGTRGPKGRGWRRFNGENRQGGFVNTPG
jgi:hypothetical protein